MLLVGKTVVSVLYLLSVVYLDYEVRKDLVT